MGRPLLRSCELRERIDCYFSSIELDGIRSRARETGLPLSAFIRKAALGAPIQVLPKANAEIWQQLSHTTANLNQIARHLNAGSDIGVPPELIADLQSQVRQLRLELVGAQS